MLKVSALVTIPTDGGDFPALDFQLVMATFRGRYAVALQKYGGEFRYDPVELNEEHIFEVSRSYVSWLPVDAALEQGIRDGLEYIAPENDLYISELRRINPIEILVLALAGPLAAAVILSGGKIEVGSLLRVQLPPIGTGVQKLREALRPTIPKKIEDIRVVRKKRPSVEPAPLRDA